MWILIFWFFIFIFFFIFFERLNQLLTGWNVVCSIDLEYNLFNQNHFYMIIQPEIKPEIKDLYQF